MSSHPNVIMKCTIKAQGTTRALLRDLLAQNRAEIPEEALPLWISDAGKVIQNIHGEDARQIRYETNLAIGQDIYRTLIMETTYNDGNQIAGEEGDLIIFKLVTYGYGEEIEWAELQAKAEALASWALEHKLEYLVSVSANYW